MILMILIPCKMTIRFYVNNTATISRNVHTGAADKVKTTSNIVIIYYCCLHSSTLDSVTVSFHSKAGIGLEGTDVSLRMKFTCNTRQI